MYTRNCRGHFIGFPAKWSNLMINYIGHLIQIFVFTLFESLSLQVWLTDWWCVYICVYVMNVCDCVGPLCVAKGELRPEIFNLLSWILKLQMCTPGFCGWFQAIISRSTDCSVIGLYSRGLEHFLEILFERPTPNQEVFCNWYFMAKGKISFFSKELLQCIPTKLQE